MLFHDFVDQLAHWRPPQPAQGSNAALVRISDWNIDLGSIHDLASHPAAHQAVRASWAKFVRVSALVCELPGLIMRLHDAPGMAWLLRQLVWALGSLLDEHFANKEWQVAAPPTKTLASNKSRFPKLTEKQMQQQWRIRERGLYQYYMVGRNFFANEFIISISLDLSRVGGRCTAYGCAAAPPGGAHWVPPQDLIDADWVRTRLGAITPCVFIKLACLC